MEFRLLIPAALAACLVVSSCGPSRKVTFNVTQPAEITLPPEVHTILLIDRTKFHDGWLNNLEGLLTGELPADDKHAAREGLAALEKRLEQSPRYSVKILDERFEGNSITTAFPQPLGWDKIAALCRDNQADAVIALEVFDSNFIVTNGTRMKKRTEGTGDNKHEVEYTEYYASGVGSVKMGIRSYCLADSTIVDEHMLHEQNSWEGTGVSALDAVAMLISKSNANKYLAGQVGDAYAYRISPMTIRVARPFYGKSKHIPEVAEGSRLADVNKWDEAIEAWKRGLAKASGKEAGEIAYNISVGYEVLGQYGQALTWAQDAYTRYGNKYARDYSYTLQRRIDEEAVLKEQMQEK